MKGLMTNMNRFDFRIYYHIIRIIKTIRCIYYGEERKSMKTKIETSTLFLTKGVMTA